MQTKEMLEAMGEKLGSLADGEAVVGSPIKLGDVTVIPISRLSVAFGAFGGEGEGEAPKTEKHHGGRGAGSASGSGGGAKLRPVGVIVFSAEGVNVVPIPTRKGKLDELLEKIPGLVERLKKVAED